uniref:Uncharacterized protein n=1 Tax=Haptolina brevifila TaxID=156173 RepID=A0A7S2H4A5_9EUKA
MSVLDSTLPPSWLRCHTHVSKLVMCAGLAVMLGPPSVGGACYLVYLKGRARVLAQQGLEEVKSTLAASSMAIASLVATYSVQRRLLAPHFDEGGALSLSWKKGTESLGEPLKIQTWRQFYRAAGPPVFARLGFLLSAFYVAGGVQAWIAARNESPPKAVHKK